MLGELAATEASSPEGIGAAGVEQDGPGMLAEARLPKRRRGASAAKRIGVRLRRERKRAGLTRSEVADRLGLSVEHYAGYESGQRRIPAGEVGYIARVLGLSTAELIARLRPRPADRRSTARASA